MNAHRGAQIACTATVVAAAVCAMTVVRRCLLLVTVVESSMEPALHSGDRILIRRVSGAGLRRGQIAVVRRAGGSSGLVIKRVAAVPGDPVPPEVLPAVGTTRVPPGCMVLLGDNPEQSSDSRLVGFYRLADLVGVARVG